MPVSDESVLSSQAYADAFVKVMSGTDLELLSDDERRVLREAREAARTEGPGYPMPTRLDPTRARVVEGVRMRDVVGIDYGVEKGTPSD